MADAAFDSDDIRDYNRRRGIKSNIAFNEKKPKAGKPKKFDKELYKKKSAIERFFSWIESYKKISPRYEVLEESYHGLVHPACALMLWRVLG